MKTLRFIIETIPFEDKFQIGYNDFSHLNEYDPKRIDGDVCLDKLGEALWPLVNTIVWEHIYTLLSQKDNFFLGTSWLNPHPDLFKSDEAEGSLYYEVFEIVKKHFNKDFYETYNEDHRMRHCFTINYKIKKESVEVVSFNIEQQKDDCTWD